MRGLGGLTEACVSDTKKRRGALCPAVRHRSCNGLFSQGADGGPAENGSIIARILEVHGGQIRAENLPGKGVAFVIALGMEMNLGPGLIELVYAIDFYTPWRYNPHQR